LSAGERERERDREQETKESGQKERRGGGVVHRMDVEIPVLAGYLNVPTQTGFSLNRISKKV